MTQLLSPVMMSFVKPYHFPKKTQPLRLFLVHSNPQSPKVNIQKSSPPQAHRGGCEGFGHHWVWQQLKSLFNEGTQESLETARTLLLKQLSILLHPHHLYNLSCVEALLGNSEAALDYLEKAIHAGWKNLKHMETDTDLDSIRHFDKYKDLVSSLQKSSLPHTNQKKICQGYQWHILQQQIMNHFDIGTPDSLEAARTLLLQQLSMIPTHHIPLYNLACVEALLGDVDSALHYLEEAIQAGYRDVGHIEKDKDLDGLRHLEKFKALVASLKDPKPTKVDPCPVPPPVHPWGEYLKTLEEMGLTDQIKNRLMLEMTQGDLTAAIQLLLDEFAHS